MKHRIITLSITLGLILISLLSSYSSVRAEPPQRFVIDTGLIIPGPHQKVRVTITGFGEDLLRVQFRKMTYSQDVCSGGVCKSSIVSNQTSAPMTLAQGEAASFDLPASFLGGVYVGVRGMVFSSSRDVRVTVQLIDTNTGQVDGVLIALINGLPGVN